MNWDDLRIFLEVHRHGSHAAAGRADSGILGHAVNRSAEDPDTVVVYLQSADLDTLRAFVAAPELEEKMGEAGVQGPPTIKLVEGQEWGEY